MQKDGEGYKFAEKFHRRNGKKHNINKAIKRSETRGSFATLPKSGRPKSANTSENPEDAEELLIFPQKAKRTLMPMLEEQLNVSLLASYPSRELRNT